MMAGFAGASLPRALTALIGLLALGGACLAETPALRKLTVGAATSWFTPDVSPEDVKWPPPPSDGMKNAPVFGYAHRWKPGRPIPNAERVQMPLYRNFDSDDPKWWDEQLDEVLFTRPTAIFLVGRGCTRPEDPYSFLGPGHMCPYKLRMMVDAVHRAAAEEAARFALFVDTGATFALRRTLTRRSGEPIDKYVDGRRDPATLFDLSDRPDATGKTALWYFWDATIKPWFDTIPSKMWYRFDDRGVQKPVIAFWDLAFRFIGDRGDTIRLLSAIRDRFTERYGVEPFFLVQTSWIANEPDLLGRPDLAGGVHDWFRPRFGEPSSSHPAISRWTGQHWERDGTPDGLSSLTEWHGRSWGVTVPGFGCGKGCRIPPVPRSGGRNFETVLARNRSASLNIVEGFNGPLEDTAIFRSEGSQWPTPNHYLQILRRFSDPQTQSTRLQAEAADEVIGASSSTDEASPLGARSGVLATSDTAGSGNWYLHTQAPRIGFRYLGLYFQKGRYRIFARARATKLGASLDISFSNSTATLVVIPPTPDGVNPVISGAEPIQLESGYYAITVTVDRGSADLDYVVVNRLP